MIIISARLGSNLRETPGLAAQVSYCLERAVTAVTMWRERGRQHREIARCAALLGHRFVDDTLIGRDAVPSNPGKPF